MRIHYYIGDKGACGFYRCLMPRKYLNGTGRHEVTANMVAFPDGRDLGGLDVVVYQRTDGHLRAPGDVTLWDSGYHHLLEAKRRGILTVVDHDDDLLNIPDKKGYHMAKTYQDYHIRRGLLQMLEAADVVTVSTEPLAKAFGRYARLVEIIPNAIDEEGWQARPLAFEREPGETVRIGYAGAFNHHWDLTQMYWVIESIVKKFPQVRFVWVRYAPEEFRRLPQQEFIEGVPIEQYPRVFADLQIDIAIAPLRKHCFNNAKSAIKFYEAAMGGVPMVAANFGPYQREIRQGETGLLAHTEREWVEMLSALITNPLLRRTIGGQAYREVLRYHTLSHKGQIWEQVYALHHQRCRP